MRGLNLSKFVKVKEDKDVAIMRHKDGHEITIAKNKLPMAHKKQLEKLPIHLAEGGGALDASGTSATEKGSQPTASQPFGTPVNLNQQTPLTGANVSQAENSLIPFSAKVPGYEEEKQALTQSAQAQANLGKNQAAAIQAYQKSINELPRQSDIINANKTKSDALFESYANKQLNPDAYWENHSKVAAGIGALISGLGQVVGAGGGPKTNQALDLLNTQMNEEVERQKNAQDQAANLWKMNRQALGDDLSADLATKNQLLVGLKYKIDQATANAQGPIAFANANMAKAKIDQEIGINNFKASLATGTKENGGDPSAVIPLLVPSSLQQKAFEDAKKLKDIVNNAPNILQNFDDAAQEARPLTGGFAKTSIAAFNPWDKTASQQGLQAALDPTYEDQTGSVRQATIDNIQKNIMPAFGDNDYKIMIKRKNLIKYLQSKAGEATAKGYGIDFKRYAATNTDAIGQQSQQAQQPQNKPQHVRQNGVIYTLNPLTGKYE